MSQRIILFSSFKLQSINLFENFPKDSSITVSWVSDAQVPIAFANSTTSLDTIFSMSQMGEKTVTPDQKWLLIGESRVAPIRIIVTISQRFATLGISNFNCIWNLLSNSSDLTCCKILRG